MKEVQELIDAMKDDRIHVAVGQIVSLHLAQDKSFLKVKVNIFPEVREVIARMTWDAVGPESGIFCFPSAGDMVIVGMAEGDDDQAYVLKRLTSREDKIPANAIGGHLVIKTLTGKKIWHTSDTRINLSREDSEPDENLVLGQEIKDMLSAVLASLDSGFGAVSSALAALAGHYHIAFGPVVGVPDVVTIAALGASKTACDSTSSDMDSNKTSPVDDELMLSDLSYTEK